MAGALAPGLLVAVAASPYADGPPPGHTGGFGEPTCRACHFDNPLDAPGGELALSAVPGEWRPGESYRIRIELRRPSMKRAGFQLSARYAAGERAGEGAGRLFPADGRSRVADSAGIDYASHTPEGTAVAVADSAAWEVGWRAPDDALARVVFHVAANAANGDDSEFGDHILTACAVARAADAGPGNGPRASGPGGHGPPARCPGIDGRR